MNRADFLRLVFEAIYTIYNQTLRSSIHGKLDSIHIHTTGSFGNLYLGVCYRANSTDMSEVPLVYDELQRRGEPLRLRRYLWSFRVLYEWHSWTRRANLEQTTQLCCSNRCQDMLLKDSGTV